MMITTSLSLPSNAATGTSNDEDAVSILPRHPRTSSPVDDDCSAVHSSSTTTDAKKVTTTTTKHRTSSRPRRLLSCITYEQATWFIFIAITLLAIVDRFTTNVWPRQSFIIGSGTGGTDSLTLIVGPWSVMAYDIVARISGRHAICCFNLLLVTRCKALEYFLANSAWINHHLIDCTNIFNANNRLHRWNAIALCILTLIHVWSILFPCVFHGYSAQVLVGTFEYPLSERKPKGFKDVNVATQTMSLQVDDVWRLVEMTILLGILTPLSVRWLARRWHIGMPLHQFIMVMYFVDIVRRHTHPHSIIFNTPFFIMWIVDKIFQMYWKRCIRPHVHRIQLDDKYMVIVWNINGDTRLSDMVGPDYYLRLNDSSLLEGRHVFTAFENRLGLRLEDIDNDDAGGGNSSTSSCNSNSSNTMKKQGGAAGLTTWSAATVIRVYDNKRVPRLGDKDPISHTQRILQTNQLDLNVWGPVPGEMSHHIKYALTAALPAGTTASSPVVLVGAGSGVGYMLDALQYYYQSGVCMEQSSTTNTEKQRHFDFKILFTTRSPSLFRWVEQMVGKIVHHGECGIGDEDDDMNKNGSNNNKKKRAKIVLALTGTAAASAKKEEGAAAGDDDHVSQIDLEEPTTTDISPRIMLSKQFGRIDFYDEIPMGSTVFCQGGLDLKNSLTKNCRGKQARWFYGRGGGS